MVLLKGEQAYKSFVGGRTMLNSISHCAEDIIEVLNCVCCSESATHVFEVAHAVGAAGDGGAIAQEGRRVPWDPGDEGDLRV